MGLSFTTPWALSAFLMLPLLWWLLRAVPPPPRRQDFPAVRLLSGLSVRRGTPARTPLWLMALRMVLAALAILAAAGPVLDSTPSKVDGPVLIVLDNGWASAKDWSRRRDAMEGLVEAAARAGRAVAILPTAEPADGRGVAATRLMAASEARQAIGALAPHPWAVDRRAALAALAGLPALPTWRVEWLSDGLDGPDAAAFGRALKALGRLELVAPAEGGTARLLAQPDPSRPVLETSVMRADRSHAGSVAVLARDSSGRVLARGEAMFASGDDQVALSLPMPAEQRNRVNSLKIEGEEGAGAVVLLDERFRRRPVGLADRGAAGATPLLDDLYYAERALSARTEVRRAPLADLLAQPPALILLPDAGDLTREDRTALRSWIESGGVLVRLAGPNLARSPDDLLPVRLLQGGRTLGGAMSWTQPMAVAPMDPRGPFAGLDSPPDAVVRAQVLAEPAIDLAEKSWARLSDGTPLVTGEPLGKGWLVLIHTTVRPDWSDLGLSGLFPAMLDRLLGLAQGQTGGGAGTMLPPFLLLDGWGRLGPPSERAESLPVASSPPVTPGPTHPPGFYGQESGRVALNLASALPLPVRLTPPAGVTPSVLGEKRTDIDLSAPLLLAAMILLLADMTAVSALMGLFRRSRGAVLLAVLILACPDLSGPAHAASSDEEAALRIRLAFVMTGDAKTDAVSRLGLKGLSEMLALRTTVVLDEPQGVDIEQDALAVYPLIYWPATETQPAPSAAARARLNDYLRHGGMILFDSRDRGEGDGRPLARLAGGLDIPRLTLLGDGHALTRSFYLLNEFPGRWADGPVYVAEDGDPANDNVSPVVVGGNDWAAAWAGNGSGGFLFSVRPGGERQRERAFRFGVNLVMVALTGSYKTDQVHLPAILERMRR